jgi:hypothetical protein
VCVGLKIRRLCLYLGIFCDAKQTNSLTQHHQPDENLLGCICTKRALKSWLFKVYFQWHSQKYACDEKMFLYQHMFTLKFAIHVKAHLKTNHHCSTLGEKIDYARD